MVKQNLQEFRCPCGKLLFKGIIFVSVVEIKCRRCSQISSFGDILENRDPFSFLILVDQKGIIKDMCRGAEASLGYQRSQIIGNSIMEFSPVIYDRIVPQQSSHPKNSKKSGHTATGKTDSATAMDAGAVLDDSRRYEISNNVFFIRDGSKLNTESYCIAPKEQKDFSGYYIFNKVQRLPG